MNLIIDIGNTRTKVMRTDGGRVVEPVFIPQSQENRIPDIAKGCDAAIVSSVAGDKRPADEQLLQALQMPIVYLTAGTPLPIGIEYGSRQTLGADRVAAAVGAWKHCPDQPSLVIDSGTCITVDLVLPGRGFVGGNISAGLDMRLAACHEHTGSLPLVERPCTDSLYNANDVLGDSTTEALRKGALMGIRYELEGYVRTFSQKYPNLAVFLTGGAAILFGVSEKVPIFVRPYLVAEGLDAILEYNKCK